MPFVSVTRLRLRSARFLPGFFFHAIRSQRQLRRSPGFQAGSLLPDAGRTFWTLSLWDSAEAMRGYMLSGAHRTAMPKLADWCDEASVGHWETPEARLPDWREAEARMRRNGRPSKVRHPSADHESLRFAAQTGRSPLAILPRGGSTPFQSASRGG